MTTLTLPSVLQRGELRSFWLALSGIVLIVLALIMGLSETFLYSVAAVLAICILGLAFPVLIRIPYRIWNKTAKLYVRFACVYLMAVTYHGVIRWLGLAAQARESLSPGAALSSWVSHEPLAVPAYESQYQTSDDLSSRASWPVGYVAWAWRSGNIPAMFLLPFLILISIVQPEQESSQVSDIYTLF